MILVLMGKSASGKDTIMNYLVDNCGYKRIVTSTTRPPREGEINGKDYFFLTEEEFFSKDFVEQRYYDTVFGRWFYGSSKDEISESENNVIILDPDGAAAFKSEFGDKVKVIYIDAPDSLRELRSVLRGSFNKDEWKRRLKDDNKRFSRKMISHIADLHILNDTNNSIFNVSNEIVNYMEAQK